MLVCPELRGHRKHVSEADIHHSSDCNACKDLDQVQFVKEGRLTWEICGGLHLLHCPLNDASPTLKGGQENCLILIDDIHNLPKDHKKG